MGKSQIIKVSKRLFIEKITKKKNCSPEEAVDIYETFMDVLTEEILKGNEIMLTGFGNFTLKYHKGHPVHFSNRRESICEYLTLRFTASNVLNSKLREPNSKLMEMIKANEAAEITKE